MRTADCDCTNCLTNFFPTGIRSLLVNNGFPLTAVLVMTPFQLLWVLYFRVSVHQSWLSSHRKEQCSQLIMLKEMITIHNSFLCYIQQVKDQYHETPISC